MENDQIEHNGECTNQGPVISTPKGAVYWSGCNNNCAKCEFWVEYKESEIKEK